jgi:hypothetical protein
MCHCLGKACLAPGGGTPKILISATNPTYICRLRFFSHGQYVAISRVTSNANITVTRVPIDQAS